MRTLLTSMALVGCAAVEKSGSDTNTAPAIAIVSPDSGHNAVDGTVVSFLAYVTDSESEPEDLMVSWASNVDGDLWAANADQDGNHSFETDDLTLGAHTITATVIDPQDNQASANVLLNIYDPGEPPTVELLPPNDDGPMIAGDPISLLADVEDPDGLDSIVLSFAFFGAGSDEPAASCDAHPGEEDPTATAASGGCSVTIDDPGFYTVFVMATDAQGNTDDDEIDELVVMSADDHDADGDGFTENDGDCDDTDSNVNPGAPEIVDGIDNNCNDRIDEGTDTVDDDGDGMSEDEGDCDDSDRTIYAGAFEYLDGVDNDCDGVIDDGTDAYDDDGDCACEGGEDIEACTGSISSSCDIDDLQTGDCDDADEDIHADAPELCDGFDNDCDDLIDGDDPSTDSDRDGYSACDGDDCDDTDSAVNPDADERCNSIDDDCDGVVDEASAIDATVWFLDADGDSYGSETSPTAVFVTLKTTPVRPW